MNKMVKGLRSKLDEYIDSNKTFTVTMRTVGNAVYDISCFGVDSSDKLSDDRYMVFYNQPETPEGAITLKNNTFTINLTKLPRAIEKLVFTVCIDGDATMGQIQSHTVEIEQDGHPGAELQLSGENFHKEKAIISVEIYYKSVWRISAVASGFDGGLEALLNHFGGEAVHEVAEPKADNGNSDEAKSKKTETEHIPKTTITVPASPVAPKHTEPAEPMARTLLENMYAKISPASLNTAFNHFLQIPGKWAENVTGAIHVASVSATPLDLTAFDRMFTTDMITSNLTTLQLELNTDDFDSSVAAKNFSKLMSNTFKRQSGGVIIANVLKTIDECIQFILVSNPNNEPIYQKYGTNLAGLHAKLQKLIDNLNKDFEHHWDQVFMIIRDMNRYSDTSGTNVKAEGALFLLLMQRTVQKKITEYQIQLGKLKKDNKNSKLLGLMGRSVETSALPEAERITKETSTALYTLFAEYIVAYALWLTSETYVKDCMNGKFASSAVATEGEADVDDFFDLL